MNPIIQGLIIAGIGMGLVFLAIVFLWGFMDVLVKVTSGKTKAEKEDAKQGSVIDAEALPFDEGDPNRLQKVAAVAVAIAMSMHKQFSVIKPQDSNSISPWQSARRTQVLGQSAALLNRKSRGTSK